MALGCTAAALLFVAPSIVVNAASPTAIEAIDMRQRGFKDMGAALKGLRDQFRRPKPVMVLIREYARELERYSAEPVMEKWFPAGAGPGQGLDTAARPEIWANLDEFARLWNEFSEASTRLRVAVTAGDMDATRQRAKEIGETCSRCHENFRVKDEE